MPATTPKPIVIEIAGQPRGVLVRRGAKLAFIAVKLEVFELDGKLFETADDARLAVAAAIELMEAGPVALLQQE